MGGHLSTFRFDLHCTALHYYCTALADATNKVRACVWGEIGEQLRRLRMWRTDWLVRGSGRWMVLVALECVHLFWPERVRSLSRLSRFGQVW